MMREMKKSFPKIIFGLLIYTLLVILWGAWVRISHSGDGCGDTWPLCQGKLIPVADQGKTWVEYSHRVMSGLYGIFVFSIYIFCRRNFPAQSLIRKMALATLFFTITEALLGAKLVLFGLVGQNSSLYRAFVMSLHQINSLFLTGSIAILWFTSFAPIENVSLRFLRKYLYIAFLILAITGAWASLSTTLFPTTSLLQGIQNDFSESSHAILRLRISHPIFALLIGSMFAIYFYRRSLKSESSISKLHLRTSFSFVFAILFGMLTLLFLSPTWMKITHLGIAHVLWVQLLYDQFRGENNPDSRALGQSAQARFSG